MPFGDGMGPRGAEMGAGRGRGRGRGRGQGEGGRGAMIRRRGRAVEFTAPTSEGPATFESLKARLEGLQSELELLRQQMSRLPEEK